MKETRQLAVSEMALWAVYFFIPFVGLTSTLRIFLDTDRMAISYYFLAGLASWILAVSLLIVVRKKALWMKWLMAGILLLSQLILFSLIFG